MARGKHSVALFEVMQSSKKSSGGMSLRTPKWWFKNKNKTEATENVAQTTTSAPAEAGSPPEMPAPVPQVVVEPEIMSDAPAPRVAGVDLSLDPDRQRITFHVSYTSAIVAAFAVVVVVGIAYIIGRHVANGPSMALAGPSTEEIRSGPVHANVLNVAPVASSNKQPAAIMDPAISSAPQPTRQSTPTTVPTAQRVIGLNYVVMQMFHDEASANEACMLLNQNNIPCTAQQGLAGFGPSAWWYVIGLKGFDHVRNNPELDRYEKAVTDINAKVPKKFARFEPAVYSWRSQSAN